MYNFQSCNKKEFHYTSLSVLNVSYLSAGASTLLQVVQYRMQAECGVETQLEPLGFSVARWVTGSWPALEKVGRIFNCSTVKDQVCH